MEPEHALDTSGQLLTQLRNATRSAHQDLEHSSLMRALMAADLSRAQYVRVLQVFASFYQHVDACFANQELAFEFFGEYQYQLRSPTLKADLLNLSSELPTADALPEWRVDFNCTSGFDRQMWLLGMAYVVEGSSQGARIILPRLHKTLGLDAGSGLGFFSRQLELSTQWQALRRYLAQPCSTLPCSTWTDGHALLACHAAQSMFEHLQRLATDPVPPARLLTGETCE